MAQRTAPMNMVLRIVRTPYAGINRIRFEGFFSIRGRLAWCAHARPRMPPAETPSRDG